MNLHRIKINVGAEKPFSLLHGSDHHICLCDERDDERKRKLAESRGNAFSGGNPGRLMEYAEEFFAYARENGLTVAYTGDFLDFTSRANFDYAKKTFSSAAAFVCAGNHEYSKYVGEAWEDEDYKADSFDDVLASFPNNNIWYDERIINGVRFVAVDNNYYYVMPEQLERFRKACEGEEPVVLLVHNPIYSAETLRRLDERGRRPDEPPYLFGCPEAYLKTLSDYRYRQQKPNELTLEFVRLCNEAKNLRAVLAGHLHETVFLSLDSKIPQVVCGAGYRGEAVLCEFE